MRLSVLRFKLLKHELDCSRYNALGAPTARFNKTCTLRVELHLAVREVLGYA